MKQYFLLFLLTLTSLSAKLVTQEQIDFNKPVIQIATYVQKENLEASIKKLEKTKDVYFQEEGDLYVLFVVNVDDTIENELKKCRQLFGDAFISQKGCQHIEKFKQSKNVTTEYIVQEEKREQQKQEIKKQKEQIAVQKAKLNKFNQAKQLFTQKKYKASYEVFGELFLKDLENPQINFFLGRSAYELGKYEEAISAYERVLIADENAHRVRLEMARSYLKLGDVKEAKKLFIQTRPNVPEKVQQNIDTFLTAIENSRKKHILTGAFIFGLNYDDNVYGVSVDNALSDKISNFTLNNRAAKSWAHQEVLAANYVYAKEEDFKYKVDTLLFKKSIFSHHDMDLHLVQVTPGVLVDYSDKLSADYSVYMNKVWLGTQRQLMNNYGINPKVKYTYAPNILLDGGVKFQLQHNMAPSQNRDNYLYSIEGGGQYIYDDKLTLSSRARIDMVREMKAEPTDNNEVAYDLLDLTFGATYKYSKEILFTPKLKIYQKNYLQVPVPSRTNEKRNDTEFQLWLAGTYIYSPDMLFTFEYIYTDHQSNYADNQFKKDSITANVIIPFDDKKLTSWYDSLLAMKKDML